MSLLRNKTIQKTLGGSFLERWGIYAFSGMQLFALRFHKEPGQVRMLQAVRRERRSLVTSSESFFIHSIASGVRHLEGDMVEVGVYAGSTAKLICEAKGAKRLHVCDTFSGLPAPTAEDGGVEKEGYFAWSLDSVQRYLAGYPHVEYHVGFCPDSVRGVLDDTRFCFVHLDVDLYSSTKQCLEYFFPRMVPGGVLVSHDYSVLQGVRDAFAEFTAGRIEQVIETPMTQCMLVRAADPSG